jgi:hypothetical protein
VPDRLQATDADRGGPGGDLSGLAEDLSQVVIAARIGRDPSVVSREIARC